MKVHTNSHGQGIPLVFFHGWGFDSQVWLPLIPDLGKHCTLILVDLPGFGNTPMMDWHEFKTNLLAQLPEQFALAGWSMGGLYATRLSLEEPEKITTLLNITSSPRFIMDSFWPGICEKVLDKFYENLLDDANKTIREFIALQLNTSKHDDAIRTIQSPSGLVSGLEILKSWDFRDRLIELRCTVCFIFGKLDPITPVKTMKMMELLYPQFEYILFSKSAHMPFLSHKDEFIEEILRLIQ